MRKRCLVIAAILLSLQITGCGAINLTTQENNVIAEYIAGILLKHDKAYEPTLQYNLEEEEDTQEPVEETKDVKEETDNEQEQNNNSSNTESENTEAEEDYADISSIYNKALSVSPVGYSFYQTYPKKMDAILPIEASAGNTICVVQLKVKNTSSSSKKIDFLMSNYSYQLNVDSENTYSAVQSVLIDDIQYLEVTLKPGKSHEAMVAFEIPKKAKNKKLNLLITKGSKTANITLK